MATWTNESKNSTSFTNEEVSTNNFILLIDSTYDLLIDSTYKLKIGPAGTGTAWSNQSKN